MSEIILPVGHLSFSQLVMWGKSNSSHESYRKKYYPDIRPHYGTTPAMTFGNEVTLAMEKNEDWVSFIPRYPVFEYDASFEFDGIKMEAHVDNMCMEKLQFCEQKTGSTPWTQNKVNKHLQLDIYSMLIQMKLGFVQDECYLNWVHTEKVFRTVEVMPGHFVTAESSEIKLKGTYQMFPRVITQKERDYCREFIVRTAKEISEDYRAMKHLYN